MANVEISTRESRWRRTLEEIFPAVTKVTFCRTRAYDTEEAHGGEGTGFIIDEELGVIATNRHIVGPVTATFWGSLVFQNHEELVCSPIYSDPVHDFGFLHVHSGVISRIDRDAPDYGSGYNDFNTYYLQAAMGAVGGSSGSPVVNIDGFAVGIQAGGRVDKAETDYFLPLDRVARALQCLRENKPITRGTIQCQWRLMPYNKCVGLTAEWEKIYREAFPAGVGMLVVERILPNGPSDSILKVGDVLLLFKGEHLTEFSRHDDILDSSVNESLKIVLQRGGNNIEVEVRVENLFDITPKRYVSVAGARFNDLSYQVARRYGVACRGVFVCDPDGSFKDLYYDSLIVSIDGQDVPCLDSFIRVWKEIPDKKRVIVTYKRLGAPDILERVTVTNDHHWSTMEEAIVNDETGLWDSKSYSPVAKLSPVCLPVTFPPLQNVPNFIQGIERSFVEVTCYLPICLNSFFKPRRSGGVVLDAKKGLVYVSQVTVPNSLCDISIIFAQSVTISATFFWQSREHGYTIIKYDPALIHGSVQSIDMSSTVLQNNAPIWLVGMNSQGKIRSIATSVIEVGTLDLVASSCCPKERVINTETYIIESALGSSCSSGVLVDVGGTVRALWSCYLDSSDCTQDKYYHRGLPISSLWSVIEHLQMGKQPYCRTLGVELRPITINTARDMKVSEVWLEKIAKRPTHHQLFVVERRILHSNSASHALIEGDVILTLNGNLITRFTEFDDSLCQETLEAEMVRHGVEQKLQLRTSAADSFDIKRALCFCGMVLQAPMFSVRQQVRTPSDVYISDTQRGSPANGYNSGLSMAQFVTELNGCQTLDLDSFLKAAKTTPANALFNMRVRGLDGIEKVIQMRRNDRDFPTVEWVKGTSGWQKTECVMTDVI
ncbi:hypothetical protein B0O99DRAFT_657340 [Bisporella sp. PMI_857]|nr:hypothetical protein B0O99DRAFT_657340 [Bisporella sp. PMI_857]